MLRAAKQGVMYRCEKQVGPWLSWCVARNIKQVMPSSDKRSQSRVEGSFVLLAFVAEL